ncbi:large ribosomal subunit protein bL32m-like [Babylonia areolata]|uniref:large ribosomal subunit protein bL32m-like n=1 Tax=Babylonia areolata TaxID=304850 RepID=UPI003FD01C65
MATSLRKCMTLLSSECHRFIRDLRVITAVLQNHGNGPPALDLVTVNNHQPCLRPKDSDKTGDTSRDVLDSVFSSVLLAVQRSRRSLEKRMTRRMQMAGHYEYAVPRKDIVVDLDTGHWKEKGTICRHHYEKVKEETKKMQEELGEAMQYTADQKEVVFLYEGEESEAPHQREKGRHVVQMKKERPSWFPRALLEKS